MQLVTRNQPVFDAVIVGSGATGGWVAKILAEAGLQVAVLEAGPKVADKDFTEHVQPYELKYRGDSPEIARNRPIQAMKYACRESNFEWFVDDIRNPYTTPKDKPFQWTRGRVLGGRTLTWGRQSYRHSPLDLKPASHDGFGEDWPITYEELIPYYERVERYIGLSGRKEGLAHLPDSVFLPPMEPNCGEKHFEQAVESKLKIPVTMGRTSILTRAHNGRAACHYCGPCEQGCITHSYFSSLWTTLVDAEKTGNCKILTDSVASHVTVDKNTGLADGVAYFDRLTRSPREVRAKYVVLCASTLESTRLLLNSGEGFCNSSGVLGRYLMDHVAGSARGVIPVKEEAKWTGAPRRPNGLYVPRFINLDRPRTEGILRGFGFQGGHGSSFGSPGRIRSLPGFGRKLKEAVHADEDCWTFSLTGFGECLPRWNNHVALDPEVKDAWGIPALRISADWSDNELQMFDYMLGRAEELLRAAGAENVSKQAVPRWPGGATHELGTARMGSDPKKSVLNKYRQTHDVANLYVTDGAAFVSSGCQNPTLTMMAMSIHSAEHLIEQARRA